MGCREGERRQQDRCHPAPLRQPFLQPALQHATKQEFLGDRRGDHGRKDHDADRQRIAMRLEKIDDRMVVGHESIERGRQAQQRSEQEREPCHRQPRIIPEPSHTQSQR